MGKPTKKIEIEQELCALVGVAHSRISDEEAREHLEELKVKNVEPKLLNKEHRQEV